MKVKITNLAKNPMQSGLAKNNLWFLTVLPQKNNRYIDKITGWTSSNNTKTQLKLKFASKEEAIKYAQENNFEYEICEANPSTLKEKSYSDNFTAPVLGGHTE